MRKVGKAKNLQQKTLLKTLIHSLNDWQDYLTLADLLVIESLRDKGGIVFTLKLKWSVTEWCFLIKQLQNITLCKNCRILCYAPQAVQQALPISQYPLSPPPFLAICPEPAKSFIWIPSFFSKALRLLFCFHERRWTNWKCFFLGWFNRGPSNQMMRLSGVIWHRCC